MPADQLSNVLILLGKGTLLALALVALYSAARRRVRNWSPTQKLLVDGLAFGTAIIVAMQFPVELPSGVIVDARDVLVLLSGLFGGFAVAGIAASVVTLYSLSVSGIGVLADVGPIVTAAALGSCFYWLLKRRKKSLTTQHFLLAGLLLAPISLVWTFTWPGAMPTSEVVATLLAPITILYSLATLIYGSFLNWEDTRVAREYRLAELVKSLHSSEARLLESQEITHIGSFEWFPDTDEMYWSAQMYRILDLDHDGGERRPQMVLDCIHPDDRQRISASIDATVQSGEPWDHQFRIQLGNGEIRNIHSIAQRIMADNGRPTRIVGTFQDISDAKRAEHVLRKSENKYRTLVESSPFCICQINLSGQIISMNRAGLTMFDLQRESAILGAPYLSAVRDPDRKRISKLMARALTGEFVEFEFRNQKGGDFRSSFVPLYDGDESVDRLLAIMHDITEQKLAEQTIARQNTHDALTGLINRSEFERRLTHALVATHSSGDEHALCFLDLDQFKVINDTHGHTAGDELLRQLALVLAGAVSKRETLARLGGDEFAVLIENCTLPNALRIANKVRRAVEDFHFAWEDRVCRIRVSVGLVPITASSHSITSVLSAADSACYAAKEKGRNRVHVYTDGDSDLAHRQREMRWVAQVERALDDNRLELWSQKDCAGRRRFWRI